jgi:hypothetical protein
MKSRYMVVPALLFASAAYAANPLSALKDLEDDGIGNSVLSAINACQPLAPSPFGSFVPANVTLTVPARTITTAPVTVTVNAPLPRNVTIPGQTVTVPATTVVFPGTALLPPAPRLCPIFLKGESAGSPPHPPGHSAFSLELVIDFSTYRSNGSGGGCSLASGSLTYVKASKGNPERLTMTHSGLLCDTAGLESAKTYNASYNITGGTGKYTAADGTGNLTLGLDAAQSLLHVEGNVLFK